ncbi:MAG: dihydropteroate synthase [Candidatus Aquicultorales bacterium]
MPEVRLLNLQDRKDVEDALAKAEVHARGIEIMAPKGLLRVAQITDLDPRGANILKQEMLSKGGEAALSWRVYNLGEGTTSAVAIGTVRQFEEIIPKLTRQPFKLKEVAAKLKAALEAYDSTPSPLEAAGRTLPFEKYTYVMGILNVTPDSFSDGGEHFGTEQAIKRAIRMAEEGADILDIGGESTRPGSVPVPLEEELRRVIPVVKGLAGSTDSLISIDSMKPEVVEAALEAGAHIVNDVNGLRDPNVIKLVADAGAPAIVMHMKGSPKTMQDNPVYDDLLGEIVGFLRERLTAAEAAGVNPGKLLVDPGIGFGKTYEDNLKIIGRLAELKVLGRPIVLGSSRKAFIGKVLGVEEARERQFGTAATVALGIANGANIVRVHDVAQMKQVARMTDAIVRH